MSLGRARSRPSVLGRYKHDPDYLGTLTQLDVQFGRILDLLKSTGVYENTVIFYTTGAFRSSGLWRKF